jgi:catechol 2,3-dioxygenase-like lactoylglutathione lyase family enzyme
MAAGRSEGSFQVTRVLQREGDGQWQSPAASGSDTRQRRDRVEHCIMPIDRLDHVQLAMPAGGEQAARAFYGGVLGIGEVAKPPSLAARGGCWFECGTLKVHLGVDPDFRPARKAHPAFIVRDLATLVAALEREGHGVDADQPLAGYARVYVDDPFGNRIELMEPLDREGK